MGTALEVVGIPLNCWLTRCRTGNYLLTAFKPTIQPVRGAGFSDAYIIPGDPIGLRHLCAGAVKSIWGINAEDLPLLTSCKVTISGERRKGKL